MYFLKIPVIFCTDLECACQTFILPVFDYRLSVLRFS